MTHVARTTVPPGSLLDGLRRRGRHADCFVVTLPARADLADYVYAFYTTRLFEAERLVLRWLARRPSTDAEALALAEDRVRAFAAWRVAARSHDEILLTDETGRTSSWLHVRPLDGGRTRLYFGSAIVREARAANGEPRLARGFRMLLGLHHAYSRLLLAAAAARLRVRVQRPRAPAA